MNQSDLMALSERLFNQLEIEYSEVDDGGLVVPTEDDLPIFVGTVEATGADGREWPVLTLLLPVLEEVDIGRIDMDLLVSANAESPFGSVELRREERAIVLYHESVGWPGAAELSVTIELVIGSRAAVEEFLAGRIPGSAPTPYSELVS